MRKHFVATKAIAAFVCFQFCIQDYLGLEQYLKHMERNWHDLPWWFSFIWLGFSFYFLCSIIFSERSYEEKT
jgi:hypothetical protein